MTTRIYVDRSRYETYGRCPRARYEQYHRGGMGIESVRKPLPLAVGGSVHVGLAVLLREVMMGDEVPKLAEAWMKMEEAAVRAALADFAQYDKSLELPDAEAAILASTNPPSSLTTKLMESLGEDPASPAFQSAVWDVRSEIDEYLFREQSALVEALVRAYSRRRLRPLLEQFEVLEVEREGEWLLSRYKEKDWRMRGDGAFYDVALPEGEFDCELWFMSRPDALLRERESNELYLLSYKITGAWDVRKARDAEHDMQGMSEGVEIERRLAEWWSALHPDHATASHHGMGEQIPHAMVNFLSALDAPPRILAVRYEYMLKGERWRDKDLSERFGVEMRSQKSHLIRQYYAKSVPAKGMAGFALGDVCWSWDYIRDDGKDSNLAWQNWKSRQVEDVRAWIDALDDAAPTISGEDSTVGLEPRLLGYKCDAQAVGVTKDHPLDAVFIPPVTVYRNEDELRDLVDQMEAVERRIAEGVAAVDATTDEGERRHMMNVHFPQTRKACEYPTTCAYSRVCYGGEDIRRDPVASGLYKIRTVNHPQELEKK